MRTLAAIRVGLADGVRQPTDFNVGMTYESDARQAAYDYASRVGQFAGRVMGGWAR